jgi:hypothetical protein
VPVREMGGCDHKKRTYNDRYHKNQGEKGNIMGEVENRGVGKGSGPRETKSKK